MASLMGFFQAAVHGEQNWPPPDIAPKWDAIQLNRYRYQNDKARLIQRDTRWHNREHEFVPVALAREIVRYSASLLFSESAKITHKTYQGAIDEISAHRHLDAFLQEAAQYVAVEGRIGVRVHFDPDVSEDMPLISYVHGDQILWAEKHGYVTGGTIVYERKPDDRPGRPVFRLLEEHGKGYVRRELYEGTETRLGTAVDLGRIDEFAELAEEEDTGLDVPTLTHWDNVPGADSDLTGNEAQLDELNEAESLLLDKGRKSTPIVFADRSMADAQGNVKKSGVILTGGTTNAVPDLGEGPRSLPIEIVQPALQSAEHLAWIEHVRRSVLTHMGYSVSSWGENEGGNGISGEALKRKQQRTLLTKAGKDRMGREAISTFMGIALALMNNASSVKEFRPVVVLGDGMPDDPMETAQEIQALDSADAISTVEKVQRLHPDWSDERKADEVARIEGQRTQEDDPVRRMLNGGLTF